MILIHSLAAVIALLCITQLLMNYREALFNPVFVLADGDGDLLALGLVAFIAIVFLAAWRISARRRP